MMVVDASVAGALLLPDEHATVASEALERLFAAPIVVPMHWHLEVASLVRKAVKRGRIERSDALAILSDGLTLDPEVDRETAVRAWSVIHPLADRTGLTVYDAAYLELASRRGAALATLDGNLRRAGEKEGLTLVDLA